MANVTVKNVTLGQGRPKVIVPIVAADLPQAVAQAKALNEHSGVDVVELRLDLLRGADTAACCACLRAVREALETKPLLATVRTTREGGEAALSPAAYTELLCALCRTGAADLLDIEASVGEAALQTLRQAAQQAGMRTVFSCHHFEGTSTLEQMVDTLCGMGRQGADIAKLAVMPHTQADAALLLLATAQAAAAMPQVPVITMSMGELGKISRLCGGAFGSAATFGTVGEASAPGQVPVAAMEQLFAALEACGC